MFHHIEDDALRRAFVDADFATVADLLDKGVNVEKPKKKRKLAGIVDGVAISDESDVGDEKPNPKTSNKRNDDDEKANPKRPIKAKTNPKTPKRRVAEVEDELPSLSDDEAETLNEIQLNQEKRILEFPALRTLKFDCEFCDRRLETDLTFMNRHMLIHHDINLLQYFVIVAEDANWMNCMLFKCLICNKFHTVNKDDFKEHLYDKHKMNTKKFRQIFSTIVYDESGLKCHECGSVEEHFHVSITDHLEKAHKGIDPDTYLASLRSHLAGKNIKDGSPYAGKVVKKSEKPIRASQTPKTSSSSSSLDKKASSRLVVIPSASAASTTESKSVNSYEQRQRQRNENAVYNGCEFQCHVCKRVEHSSGKMLEHFKQAHKKQTCSLQLIQHKMTLQRNEHRCRICGDHILRDLGFIEDHAKTEHDVDLNGYKAKKELPIIDFPSHDLKRVEDTEDATPPSSFEDWVNGCAYKCQFCQHSDETFASVGHLSTHLSSAHKVTKFPSSMKQHMIVQQEFECRECGEKSVRDRAEITRHFESAKHTVASLEDYYEKYIVPESLEALGGDAEKDERRWFHGSKYSCYICADWSGFSRAAMKQHLRLHHDTVDMDNLQDFREETAKFTCRECRVKVAHDKEDLEAHFKSHSMTLEGYYEKHVAKNKHYDDSEDEDDPMTMEDTPDIDENAETETESDSDAVVPIPVSLKRPLKKKSHRKSSKRNKKNGFK